MSDSHRVASSSGHVCPLLNGAKIPEVTMTTADGERFDLAGAIKAKPTVLVFYRGGW